MCCMWPVTSCHALFITVCICHVLSIMGNEFVGSHYLVCPPLPQETTMMAAINNQAHRKGPEAPKSTNILNCGNQGSNLVLTTRLHWISAFIIFSFLHQILHKYSFIHWGISVQFWILIFLLWSLWFFFILTNSFEYILNWNFEYVNFLCSPPLSNITYLVSQCPNSKFEYVTTYHPPCPQET